jgi:hypothetical protein
MMGPVGEPETSSAAVDADLLAFVRRLRARYGRGAAMRAAQQLVLAAAVPAIVLAWLVPAHAATIALVLITMVALAAGAAWHAARGRASRSLAWFTAGMPAEPSTGGVGGGAGDPDDSIGPRARATLAELGDELATWLEPARPGDAAMRRWLADDVRSKLPAVPARALATLGRRRLGRVLWLLPIAVLLLLAWLLSFLLSPPWTGALGGGGRSRSDPQNDEPQPPPDEPRNEPKPPPPAPPAPPEGPEPPPEQPQEPAPLVDLPTQHKFLVPEFVGDGPTRRVRMHAAEVEDGPDAAAVNRSGSTAADRRLPPPTRDTFERAAEAAQRARHVPPAERAVVARYFEALREAAK